MGTSEPAAGTESRRAVNSRRQAIALMLGASCRLPAAPNDNGDDRPLRLAISQSLVADVNLSDAKAAFVVWMEHLSREMRLGVEYNPAVFDTTPEILSRVRTGWADAVAINILEYRQIADLLDGSQLVISEGETREQCVLLVKRDSGIQKLGDLRGRRLIVQNTPTMCVAPAWLSVLLAENGLEPSERFFAVTTGESKPARVVLPVFFNQVEACLISKRGFSAMSELNPQLAVQLTQLAISPPLVAAFYIFRKGYLGTHRDNLIEALSTLDTSPAGQQLKTMFQFENLAVRDASCLTSALTVLEKSDRLASRTGTGSGMVGG